MSVQSPAPQFSARLARSQADREAAQRLRYDVFVRELGGSGPGVDHTRRLEQDRFDPVCQHLLVQDTARPDAPVIAVYRLLDARGAAAVGGYYSETEFDLGALKATGRPLLELGRSCVHPHYRGGAALLCAWQALAQLVAENGADLLFGVASFRGTDVAALAHPLSQLARAHRAPPELRVRSRVHQPMNLLPPDQIDRRRAMVEMPALIKSYLRLGGVVGEGAFVDHAFKTTDVCLILDTARLSLPARGVLSRSAP